MWSAFIITDALPNENIVQQMSLSFCPTFAYTRAMQDSIFTKIIKGEIPSHTVYEDEHTIAFLDINPLSNGHVLVVPKQQIDSLWALPTEVYQHLWAVAQQIAHAMETELKPERVGVVVEGFDVPHAHIHLVPLYDREVLQLHHDYPTDTSDTCLSTTAQRLAAAVSSSSRDASA